MCVWETCRCDKALDEYYIGETELHESIIWSHCTNMMWFLLCVLSCHRSAQQLTHIGATISVIIVVRKAS